jgi:hypothetical protein
MFMRIKLGTRALPLFRAKPPLATRTPDLSARVTDLNSYHKKTKRHSALAGALIGLCLTIGRLAVALTRAGAAFSAQTDIISVDRAHPIKAIAWPREQSVKSRQNS